MGQDDTGQDDRPIVRDNGNQPVMIAPDIENIARTDTIYGPAIDPPYVIKAFPLRLLGDPPPRKQMLLGIGMRLPEFAEPPLRDDPHVPLHSNFTPRYAVVERQARRPVVFQA
ncbi:MAG TPA: hypothetical protein VJ783_22765 [Pirellulales bacterium]|nr:hypothetical protein [Pirellulales bacterium]